MIVRFEDCEIDLARVVLRRAGEEIRIEPQVFDLLSFLIQRRGGVVRKEELLDEVWGDRFVSESALTTRIKSLRQAVGDDGSRQGVIRTVHGKGYEFVAEVQVVASAAMPVSVLDASTLAGSVLPSPLQSLIGREELIAELVRDQGNSRLITLVGAGGVGKTSVAYELARRIVDNHADGVFVVELVTVVDDEGAFGAFATSLDVNTPQQVSIEEAIVDMLRQRSALLVLDNCEHLVAPVAMLVDRILRAAPDVSIVATSREPLAVSGEHVWTVDPLPTPDADALLDQLAVVPAVALFVERAQAADPRFRLDEVTAPAVIEICRRLDGIPLAIELAASRASAIDVAEVAQRLNERFRLLKGVRRGADPRHQTLSDAISWSFDLLDEDERRMFTSLSVFAGQFDLGAAESICRDDDALDLLIRLTRRSMLAVRRPDRGGTRYEMLETLREYGREQLADGERFELFAAHTAQFAALARSVEFDLRTSQEGDAVARADGSFADLRAALRFALQVEDYDTAFGLIGSVREYAMRTLRYEVFAWAESTASVDESAHPLHHVVTGARAYGAFVRGEFDSARALALTARASEVATGATPTGLVERVLSNVAYSMGDPESAALEGLHQIELAEDSRDDSRVAHACYMASIGASSVGDYDRARQLIERSRRAGRRTGSPTDLASSSAAEGFALHADADAALEAFAAADRLARSAGNRWMATFARTEASGLLIHRGSLAEGCAGLAEMIDTWYRAGEWAQQWHTLSRCVVALERLGQHELGAQVLGAIEARTTVTAPPVMTTLRDLAIEARALIIGSLGQGQTDELWAEGAAMPVATVVARTRLALLGRAQPD